MAIYKSSFNRKEKKNKQKSKQQESIESSIKLKKSVKVNKPLICLLSFLLIFVLCCLPNNFFKNFVLGVVGLTVYPLCVSGIAISILFMQHKKITVKKRYLTYLIIAISILWFVIHLILTSRIPKTSYGSFLIATYKAKTTAGGIIYSLISYPMQKYLTTVGSYIFSVIALAIFVGLIVDFVVTKQSEEVEDKKSKFNFTDIEQFEFEKKQPTENEIEEENKRIARRKLGLEKGESTIISSSMPTLNITEHKPEKITNKRDYILSPLEPVIPPESNADLFDNKVNDFYSTKTFKDEKRVEEIKTNSVEEIKPEIKPENQFEQVKPQNNDLDFNIFSGLEDFDSEEYSEIGSTSVDENELNKFSTEPKVEQASQPVQTENIEPKEFETHKQEVEAVEEKFEENEEFDEETKPEEIKEEIEEIDVDVTEKDFTDQYAYNPSEYNLGSTVETEVVKPSVDISRFNLPNMNKTVVEVKKEEPKPEPPKQKEPIPPYNLPPAELLNYVENTFHISEEELQDNITRLEQVLEDFKVPAKVNNVQVGPAVTRYELTMPRGISVNKIAQMSDDIAMTLASNGAIRVEAPIPGKNSVGVEVPNKQISAVSLRELVESNEFKMRGNPLSFVLGKDINGDIIFCNLDKMPHLLIAGSTGSGKSVCLNTMLLSMCYKVGPEDLRLILVDPKTVEFATYAELPHLLIPEIITNKTMTINALDWAIREMERRYALFAKNHVVNINEYNKLEIVKTKQVEKLPFIVIVVDELADLMLEAKRELEDRIAKLAAKARAAGIHLVLATQRPSVDVITGTIKANLPSRISFALTNYMDSKTVLDGSGAEKLLGKGDMLFKPQDKPEPRRVQGAYVSNAEISAVVDYIKLHNKPVYDEDADKAIKNKQEEVQSVKENVTNEKQQEFDPVLKDALRLFIQNKQASASMISRRYSVGFNRAGRIMDQMEMAGFIGPQDGSKPRQVLITMAEYEAIFGKDEN